MTRVRFPSPAPCANTAKRRFFRKEFSPFGSVAEHSLGKGEVPGPIPGMGTSFDLIFVFVLYLVFINFWSLENGKRQI